MINKARRPSYDGIPGTGPPRSGGPVPITATRSDIPDIFLAR